MKRASIKQKLIILIGDLSVGNCGDEEISRVGRILYECHFQFHFMLFVPCIMLIITIFFSINYIKYLKKKIFAPDYAIKIVKIFLFCMILFLCITNVLGLMFRVDLYKKTVVAYQNGDYQIVEGYVENFEPMGSDGYPPEKFEINGIRFEYSDHRIVSGYHKAKGDCTIKSGQHLRIGYIYYGGGYGNIIVYIEELP